MTPLAPPIFSPRLEIARASLIGRLWAAIIAAGCLSVLITAAVLRPNPAGVGTHTQMGLPDCAMLRTTGIPCMMCGMTTSFSWFARGNMEASFYIQPMGTILAVLTACMIWTAGYVAVTGLAVHRLLLRVSPRYYVVPLVAFALLAWAWKIFIHLKGIDGWPV